jgi:hypothetical protein
LDRIKASVDDIMSVHDIVKSRSGVSGNTIAYMQEIDESNFGPTVTHMGNMWSEVMEASLKLMGDYYDTPRMVRMSGRDATVIEESFRGSMLNENYSAHCTLLDGLPVNKIARQQTIYQAVDKQILTPEQAGRYLEFGEFEEAIQKLNEDREIAIRAARVMEGGTNVPVHEWDNHAIFVEVLQEIMRKRFDNWPTDLGPLLGSKVQQIFSMSLDLHQKVMAMSAQAGNLGAPIPGLINSQPGGGVATPGAGDPGALSGSQPPMPGGADGGKSAAQPPKRMMPPAPSLQNT